MMQCCGPTDIPPRKCLFLTATLFTVVSNKLLFSWTCYKVSSLMLLSGLITSIALQ